MISILKPLAFFFFLFFFLGSHSPFLGGAIGTLGPIRHALSMCPSFLEVRWAIVRPI